MNGYQNRTKLQTYSLIAFIYRFLTFICLLAKDQISTLCNKLKIRHKKARYIYGVDNLRNFSIIIFLTQIDILINNIYMFYSIFIKYKQFVICILILNKLSNCSANRMSHFLANIYCIFVYLLISMFFFDLNAK